MKTRIDDQIRHAQEQLNSHTPEGVEIQCQCEYCLVNRTNLLLLRERQKFIQQILKHKDCRQPHNVGGNYVSCLIMILAEITKEAPWDLVKKLNVELK